MPNMVLSLSVCCMLCVKKAARWSLCTGAYALVTVTSCPCTSVRRDVTLPSAVAVTVPLILVIAAPRFSPCLSSMWSCGIMMAVPPFPSFCGLCACTYSRPYFALASASALSSACRIALMWCS